MSGGAAAPIVAAMLARSQRLGAATAIAVLALTTTAAALSAGSEADSAGAVAATLSWDAGPGEQSVDNARLTIARSGTTALNAPIPDVVCDGCELATVPAGQRHHGDVGVFDLDHDGEPEVVVEGFTGGVECCVNIGIYDYRPASGTYGKTVRDFAGGDFALEDLARDGHLELVSHDQRFVGLFGGERDAWPPPLVERYEHRGGVPRLVDATRRFPAVVQRDARAAHGMIDRTDLRDVDVPPVLAGYVADEYLLGRPTTGLHMLELLTKRGELGSAKHAAAYRARLLRTLHRLGYR